MGKTNSKENFDHYGLVCNMLVFVWQKWRRSQSDGCHSFPITFRLPLFCWGKVYELLFLIRDF